ncbi:MAG TPA: HPF/RaiA family ribosome-associated protein [Tepidisphaeraceae bacterium]|nr:HPF/RaiA family ribosome-associated protein [Tepidisphaeraceae bacterium]
MSIEVYCSSFRLTEAIVRHVRGHVEGALRPARGRWESAIVRLADLNADHGGIDKACRIVVRLDTVGAVVARAVDRDLYAAIDRAAERLRTVIKRRLSRRRTLRRENAQRLPAGFRRGHFATGAM